MAWCRLRAISVQPETTGAHTPAAPKRRCVLKYHRQFSQNCNSFHCPQHKATVATVAATHAACYRSTRATRSLCTASIALHAALGAMLGSTSRITGCLRRTTTHPAVAGLLTSGRAGGSSGIRAAQHARGSGSNGAGRQFSASASAAATQVRRNCIGCTIATPICCYWTPVLRYPWRAASKDDGAP